MGQAAQRFRIKSMQRKNETKHRVKTLKTENEKLQERINQKQKELEMYKELLLNTLEAKSKAGQIDLETFLADSEDEKDRCKVLSTF